MVLAAYIADWFIAILPVLGIVIFLSGMACVGLLSRAQGAEPEQEPRDETSSPIQQDKSQEYPPNGNPSMKGMLRDYRRKHHASDILDFLLLSPYM